MIKKIKSMEGYLSKYKICALYDIFSVKYAYLAKFVGAFIMKFLNNNDA